MRKVELLLTACLLSTMLTACSDKSAESIETSESTVDINAYQTDVDYNLIYEETDKTSVPTQPDETAEPAPDTPVTSAPSGGGVSTTRPVVTTTKEASGHHGGGYPIEKPFEVTGEEVITGDIDEKTALKIVEKAFEGMAEKNYVTICNLTNLDYVEYCATGEKFDEEERAEEMIEKDEYAEVDTSGFGEEYTFQNPRRCFEYELDMFRDFLKKIERDPEVFPDGFDYEITRGFFVEVISEEEEPTENTWMFPCAYVFEVDGKWKADLYINTERILYIEE